MSNNSNDIYDSLRKKIDETIRWPEVFLFKFIIKADNHKIALLESLFTEQAEISHHPSSTGKYISISVKEVMTSTDEVIEIYKKASAIEGVITL